MVWETLAQLVSPLSVGRGVETLHQAEVASCKACEGASAERVVRVCCWLGVVANLRVFEDAHAEVVGAEGAYLSRLQLDNQTAGLSIDQLNDARARC